MCILDFGTIAQTLYIEINTAIFKICFFSENAKNSNASYKVVYIGVAIVLLRFSAEH